MKFPVLALLLIHSASLQAAVYNLKVVTDASPDYSDMDSMIRSATSNWQTPEEKMWAMFYWNHIARRQTSPMMLHGMALTDPIRQFNDYGYTMCSTISGINCSIWDAMGFKTRYWDISNHTVSEVEYGGAWHMYDNSMTALYTRCDGKTIAGVEEIGKTMACEASEGRSEPGHIARYHCLQGTSPRGFLSGADTIRSLDEEYRCFNPNGLKYRSYFYDSDRGHRYILNLRENETYTRHYHSLGTSPEFYVANNGKDPEAANTRYNVRGNGVWKRQIKEARSFKVDGANVVTAMRMRGKVSEPTSVFVSTSNGQNWTQVGRVNGDFTVKAFDQVNGAYEPLVRFEPGVARDLEVETTTMLNGKTQPKLNIGRNTIYVGAGEQTESIVYWPDLQGDRYKPYVVEEHNIATAKNHPGYMGVMRAKKGGEHAYVVFKIDAPREITSVTYGGRLYNRAPSSHIDLLHSLDQGKTWTRTYSLTNTAPPWDVIHYDTIKDVPSGARSVLFKYLLESPEAGTDVCSLYAVRMEVNHKAAHDSFKPMQVTFNWSERHEDYSLVERSHTETVSKLPHRYTINVDGADHPIVNSLEISSTPHVVPPSGGSSAHANTPKYIPKWATYGKNFALNKPYTVSIPSYTNWGAGDPEGKKLTDGIVGPPYPGGTAPASALGWDKGQNAEITVDLGAEQKCGAFRIQVGAGYPWWDAIKGEFKDKAEVLTSTDGQNFTSQGFFNFNLRWKDLPVNHFWPDEEIIAAHNFELIPKSPVNARYVRFKVYPERSVTVSEVEVLDSIKYTPFDLRIALP
ncbi:MAG TPA: discoidin domain-containing protein [Verrucomicrobiae bacterium]|nr:discoidin domain-containing protein [Verrucomicrobiae bacterium]